MLFKTGTTRSSDPFFHNRTTLSKVFYPQQNRRYVRYRLTRRNLKSRSKSTLCRVTARDDDVINVAGHRLSTSALEDVVFTHPDIEDACVIGVPEATKGDIPMCLFVLKKNTKKCEEAVVNDLRKMVRELVGPIASFRLAVAVNGLPRTRSGKVCRKSIADLARNKQVKISGTVEDPTVYKDIKITLQRLGYARTAPDPE